jgi:ketosteroid isomerase-like protein
MPWRKQMKIRLLLSLAGLAVGSAVPTLAQEQNTVDPEVRQQIEAVLMKLGEAYNKHDAAAITALYTQNAVQVWAWETAGGAATGQQAIEKRAAAMLASNPAKLLRKLIQVYPVGDEICAISEFEHTFGKKGYCVAIYVRELDEWKIRMALLEMMSARDLAISSAVLKMLQPERSWC